MWFSGHKFLRKFRLRIRWLYKLWTTKRRLKEAGHCPENGKKSNPLSSRLADLNGRSQRSHCFLCFFLCIFSVFESKGKTSEKLRTKHIRFNVENFWFQQQTRSVHPFALMAIVPLESLPRLERQPGEPTALIALDSGLQTIWWMPSKWRR